MTIAAFVDVDGTLVDCQTQFEVAKYFHQKGIIRIDDHIKILVWFFFLRLNLIRSTIPMRKQIYSILKRYPRKEIDKLFLESFELLIKPKINYELKKNIKNHFLQKHDVIAISGTINFLCDLVCQEFGIQSYFATDLIIKNERYSGEWRNKILEGNAKVELIKDLALKLNIDLNKSYFYADSFSDLPGLMSVGYPVVVGTDKRLCAFAHRNKWRIINKNDG